MPVTFVGHPLAREAATSASRREAREQLKLGIAQPVFALLPGSRTAELDQHGDLLLKTAAAIHAARPESRFLVPLATRPTRDRFETSLYRLGLEALPLTLLYGHASDALRAADVGIVASGTATLEAALARCPHVIFYRVNALTARLLRGRLLVPWVGLPNVLAGQFVVPELLQEEATVENLAQAALNLYDDTVTRRRLEALFAGFAAALDADTGALRGRGRGGGAPHVGLACERSHADRGHRRSGARAAGRAGVRGRGDPRSRAAGSRAARFEAADGGGARAARRSRSARTQWPGRWPRRTSARSTTLNILQATLVAMQRAVAALAVMPVEALVDGNRCPALPCPARAIVKGDRDVAVDFGGVDPRQDRARRAADRARRAVSALRIRAKQGLWHGGASGRTDRPWSVPRAPAVVRAGRAGGVPVLTCDDAITFRRRML